MSNQVLTTLPRGLAISENPDAWDMGMIVPATQALAVGTYYLSHVPRRFWPVGGMRFSFVDVTAGEIEYAVSVGNEGLLLFNDGFLNWQYTSGVDSWVVPPEAFAPWVLQYGLPPGAAMRLGIGQILGVGYGLGFYGLRSQMMGYWDN